jgi:hypothetical protein
MGLFICHLLLIAQLFKVVTNKSGLIKHYKYVWNHWSI